MAGKYGPASALFLVDGYDLLASKLKGISDKVVSEVTDVTGLGDTFRTYDPTGVLRSEITQEGGFFDTTTAGHHAAVGASLPGSPQATVRIVCIGYEGQTVGNKFVGFEGAYVQDYEVVADPAASDLTRANASYMITGQRDAGVILQELEAKTADWNTETESVDNLASSASGGVGYLQVTAVATFTNFIGTIKDSTDDATFVTLIAFTDNVTAPFAERKTVSGTVDRYLSFDGNVTGSGSITSFCGFSRG